MKDTINWLDNGKLEELIEKILDFIIRAFKWISAAKPTAEPKYVTDYPQED